MGKEEKELFERGYPIADIENEENQKLLVRHSVRTGRVTANTLGVVLDPRADDTMVEFRDFETGVNFCVAMPQTLLHLRKKRFKEGESVVIGDDFRSHPDEWNMQDFFHHFDRPRVTEFGSVGLIPGLVGYVLSSSLWTDLGLFAPAKGGVVEYFIGMSPLFLRWDVTHEEAKGIKERTGNEESKIDQDEVLKELRELRGKGYDKE